MVSMMDGAQDGNNDDCELGDIEGVKNDVKVGR